jgi:N-acetylglucosaminyl-diphospho-decaprenol L-rhamnosyltransferase
MPILPDLSVIIVSYRTPQLTTAAAASALALEEVRQVVVVDNASGDDTEGCLQALQDDRVEYVVNPTNAGYGKAANAAAARANSDLLLFLNSDAQITGPAARTLAEEVSHFGGRCIAGPRLVSEDGSIQRSAGLLPAPSDLTVRALGLHRVGQAVVDWPLLGSLIRGSRLSKEYALAVDSNRTITTSMVSGAVWMVGRETFMEMGGFDEHYFLYFEDADLCRTAHRAGVAVVYVPAAQVRHIWGASSQEDYHFSPRHARSMRQYLGKWYGRPGAALAVVLMFLRAIGLTVGSPARTRRAWGSFAATLGFGGEA